MTHATQIHGRHQALEYLAGWQRSRADLANLQKSLASEHAQQHRRVTRQVAEQLLALADHFNNVTQHLPDHLTQDPWAQGVIHVARQLDDLLAGLGITPIKAAGDMFDPAKHEAVAQTSDTNQPSGQVVDVVQTGYQHGDDIIRPAKVKVAQ